MKKLLIVGSLAMGCHAGGGGDYDPTYVTTPVVRNYECDITVSPDPELYQDTLKYALAWSATGICYIDVAPGGVPIRLGYVAPDSQGRILSASTTTGLNNSQPDLRWPVGVVVDEYLDAESRGPVIGHELGHVIGAKHTDTGIMRESPEGSIVDDAAVESACQWLAC